MKTTWALYDGMKLIATGTSTDPTEAIIAAAVAYDPAPEQAPSQAGDRVRNALRGGLRWQRGGARRTEGLVESLKGWA